MIQFHGIKRLGNETGKTMQRTKNTAWILKQQGDSLLSMTLVIEKKLWKKTSQSRKKILDLWGRELGVGWTWDSVCAQGNCLASPCAHPCYIYNYMTASLHIISQQLALVCMDPIHCLNQKITTCELRYRECNIWKCVEAMPQFLISVTLIQMTKQQF